MCKNMDCTTVERGIRLQDLMHWKTNGKESLPFYLHMGDSGGLVFNGKPDIVRHLIRIYNTQSIFFDVTLLYFLNEEGIAAHRVSAPLDDVLGYHVELSNN